MGRDLRSRLRGLAPVVRKLWRGTRPAEGDRAAAVARDADDPFQAEMRLCPGHLVTLTLSGPALLLLPEWLQEADLASLVLLEELSRPDEGTLRARITATA